jgi:DNA-binding response OmpR family regulator
MEKIKILLVDDEKEFVETLAERIKMRDQDSNVALNGEEALKRIDDDLPDVVILDLKMPGMDGMEVLRRIRKAYPDVQVIMLTGHGTDKDEEEAKKLGAFEYLQKPVNIETLMKKIKKAYKKKFELGMSAAVFAESGEFDIAKDILEDDEEKSQEDKKKDRE